MAPRREAGLLGGIARVGLMPTIAQAVRNSPSTRGAMSASKAATSPARAHSINRDRMRAVIALGAFRDIGHNGFGCSHRIRCRAPGTGLWNLRTATGTACMR